MLTEGTNDCCITYELVDIGRVTIVGCRGTDGALIPVVCAVVNITVAAEKGGEVTCEAEVTVLKGILIGAVSDTLSFVDETAHDIWNAGGKETPVDSEGGKVGASGPSDSCEMSLSPLCLAAEGCMDDVPCQPVSPPVPAAGDCQSVSG